MNPLDLNKDPEIAKSETTNASSANQSSEEKNTVQPAEITETTENEVQTSTTVKEEIPAEPVQTEKESTVEVDYTTFSAAELVDALRSLLNNNVDTIKEPVEQIKQLFYKKIKADFEEQKQVFIEAGNPEEDFIGKKNENEDNFKALLNEYRSKKAGLMAQLEREKEANLLQKQHILGQMKMLVDSNDDVSSHINEFKNLQQKWKSIGQVPQSATTDLWKQYNIYQESFWDLIKINNELREYDFRKNLELKTAICEAAEKLAEEPDVIIAFQNLQKLHEEWHELGPVAREVREEIWLRFKEASTVINKKHQSYFDNIRKLEDENYNAKVALCEKIEAYDYSTFNTYKAWDEATKVILNWQEEWRAIGFAPRKLNQKIFDRYRKACDAFFEAKGEFYKETKSVLSHNADLKKTLCEKAEALKDSTEWKETADKLIQLQKDWKKIGPVAKKQSDELWNRFISACDFFFDQKNKNSSGQRKTEAENLTKKKELISKINSFEKSDNPSDSINALKTLMAEWNEIGHVPFKEKDKVYKEYREAVDKQFDALNVDSTNRRMDTFRHNLKDMTTKGENKLYREREKLVRAYEHLKSEILTYENNMGFFTQSSKKGGGLIKEMERKIESLKEESLIIEQKINLIDENIQ